MIFCLAGTIEVGFFIIAYFDDNPQQAGRVSQNSELVFIELAMILFIPWLPGILFSAILAAVGDEHHKLPVAVVFQRDHRRSVQGIPAPKCQPA